MTSQPSTSAEPDDPEPPDRPGLLKVSTDGSCLGGKKTKDLAAGYGVFFGKGDRRNIGRPLGTGVQSNQRAELKAVLHVLETISPRVELVIRTDSQYTANAITKWDSQWKMQSWKKPQGLYHDNMDLIKPCVDIFKRRIMTQVTTIFYWVKGHSNDPGNEAADELASQGSRQAYFDRYKVRYKPRVNRSLPQNQPNHPDFVRGKKVVRDEKGDGERLVDLNEEEAEAQRSVMRWKVLKDPVDKEMSTSDKDAKANGLKGRHTKNKKAKWNKTKNNVATGRVMKNTKVYNKIGNGMRK